MEKTHHLVLQQFHPGQHAFVLITHETAKGHLSLTHMQYKTVFFQILAIRRLCLGIHIKQHCILQKPLNFPEASKESSTFPNRPWSQDPELHCQPQAPPPAAGPAPAGPHPLLLSEQPPELRLHGPPDCRGGGLQVGPGIWEEVRGWEITPALEEQKPAPGEALSEVVGTPAERTPGRSDCAAHGPSQY